MTPDRRLPRTRMVLIAVVSLCLSVGALPAAEPTNGAARALELGGGVTLEVTYIPPGEYACRGGRPRGFFWWGNEIEAGEGRLNISAIDLLPGRSKTWPLAKAPWSDGFAFVSPVGYYGERGRNGFGLADMCGGVWEIALDHFDPKGGHEEPYFVDQDPHPVCRCGTYFDVPGNARCAVRLGLQGPAYSDSRDGFRICMGRTIQVR